MKEQGRLAELSANLAAVHARIESACAAAHRDRAEVTLVAVSKTWPASDVLAMRSLGVTDFGESYDQEASAKAAALAAMRVRPRWHFVGRLQRNKCRSVAAYADLVHAVDRPELVPALSAAATRQNREVGVLLQLSLDEDPERGGVGAAALEELAAAVSTAPSLVLRGLMAVAPISMDVDAAFSAMHAASAELRMRHPQATVISAGMTSDLEAAVRNGSTCVRVGTALFGRRPLCSIRVSPHRDMRRRERHGGRLA